jgi:uncharacterized protein YdcH (DUF465 family)
MEMTNQEELKAHLMATSNEFRAVAERHSQLHKRLEEIEAKAHLTLEDEEEENRIKKQKLRLKDEMNFIVSQYKTQQVA